VPVASAVCDHVKERVESWSRCNDLDATANRLGRVVPEGLNLTEAGMHAPREAERRKSCAFSWGILGGDRDVVDGAGARGREQLCQRRRSQLVRLL
jgi:hypothetical protein